MSEFADDAALYTTSCENFEMIVSFFIYHCGSKGVGWTVRLMKSKEIVVGTSVNTSMLSLVPVGDGFTDLVEDFQFLGSCISKDGKLDKEASESQTSKNLVICAPLSLLIELVY